MVWVTSGWMGWPSRTLPGSFPLQPGCSEWIGANVLQTNTQNPKPTHFKKRKYCDLHSNGVKPFVSLDVKKLGCLPSMYTDKKPLNICSKITPYRLPVAYSHLQEHSWGYLWGKSIFFFRVLCSSSHLGNPRTKESKGMCLSLIVLIINTCVEIKCINCVY